MEIELWADVVCPWCYIGKRKLEQALKLTGLDVQVRHRAFQLDPHAKSAGRRTAEVLGEKYGASAEQVQQMMARVTQVAAEVGLTLNPERTLSGNTRTAHRLLKHAASQGLGGQAWEHMFRAYFTDGRSLFDSEALEAIAKEIGVKDSAPVLSSDAYAQDVDEDLALARDIGITGVPFFVVDRRLAVSGAQPAEVLARMIEQAATTPP